MIQMNRWDDTKCSVCGDLAQYRTDMYLKHRAAPGVEYLCGRCKEVVEFPPNTITLVTRCADTEHGARRRSAACWCEITSVLEADNPPEKHFLCAEHAWKWRRDLGPEWEMRARSLHVNGEEGGEVFRFHRDDLAGAFWGDESTKIN